MQKYKVCLASFYSDINERQVEFNIKKAKEKSRGIIMLGDCNAHSTLWGSQHNNHRGDLWEQYIASNDMNIENIGSTPTFKNHLGESHIDISLTSRANLVSYWENADTFNGSDHTILMMAGHCDAPVTERMMQNIDRTDWNLFLEELEDIQPHVMNTTQSLDSRARSLINNITSAFNKACPPMRAYPGRPCKWWTKALTNLLRNKRLASRRAKRHAGTPMGIRAKQAKRELNKLFQKTLRNAKSESWKSFTSSLDSHKSISSVFKALKRENSQEMPLLTSPDGQAASSPYDNLCTLRRTHFANSTTTFHVNTGDDNHKEQALPDSLNEFLNMDLLNKAIGSLPNGKAPGPDGIPNEVIQRLPVKYREELLRQIKSSIELSYIPSSWLKINAIYIKKGGKRQAKLPKSYRPIGLSSTILKLAERLINWQMKSTVLDKGIPKQHAFTLGLSTETAISELVNFLEKAKYNNMKAIVLSIDIEGAFDSVPFDVIRDSLIEHGVNPKVVAWIDYLSRNRVIVTKMGESKLQFRPLEGTTQGGLNGPDIWIICMWSIILTSAAKMSKLSKFADDLISALMGKDLNSIRDVMQLCLDDLDRWLSEKGLRISPSKSYCMIVNRGRSSCPPNLTLNGVPVPYVEDFKYLGVTLDSKLSWRPHISERIAKAKKDLMTARKLVNINWGLTPERFIWLYKSIVRPCLDYSCHVWITPKGIPKWVSTELDKVQRLAMVIATTCVHTTPTRALERLLNLQPLDLHLKQKSATTIARIFESVNKSNWDGIGINDKRGHLFAWRKYLGKDLPPIRHTYAYNFSQFSVNIENGSSSLRGLNVYTDGSKQNQKTGSGWAILLDGDLILKGSKRLPEYCTVYEAELYAVIFAIEDLDSNVGNNMPSTVTFSLDSQAVLHTLRSIKLKGGIRVSLVEKVRDFERKFNTRIEFRWVKSHCGILGNEIADAQAKRGCQTGDLFRAEPSLSYIRRAVGRRVAEEWDNRWSKLDTCRQSRELITFPPNDRQTRFMFSKGRQGSRKIIAILTGHNNLNYHVHKRFVSKEPNLNPLL